MVRLQLVQDRSGHGEDGLWSGIDTTLAGAPLVQELPPESARRVSELLARYVARIDSARPLVAAVLRPRLRELLTRAGEDLERARQGVDDGLAVGVAAHTQLTRALEGDPFEGELRRLHSAQLTSSDLIVDGTSEDARVVPGQRVGVTVSAWNPGTEPATADLCLEGGDLAWKLAGDSGARRDLPRSPGRGVCLGFRSASGMLVGSDPGGDPLPPGRVATARLEATVPRSAEYTAPYYLRLPRQGDLYQWDRDDRASWGLPFEPARFRLTIGAGDDHREITLRGNDQGSGEFRRPVAVVPRLDVRLDPELEVWPIAGRTGHAFTVTLIHGARDTTAGTVRLQVPLGWSASPPQSFQFTREDEQAEFRFTVDPPASLGPGAYPVSALAFDNRGPVYDVGLVTVDHPHIRPRTYLRQAAATVRVADLVLPALHHVAYLRGAADRLPEALQSVGLPVELITGAELGHAPLARYDVIVVGPRAWETDAELAENNDRLVAYARGGGTVIVQYQQYAYFLGNFAPFPLTVGSRAPGTPNAATSTTRPAGAATPALLGGHDRVTDETAPVTVVDRASPLLRQPNRIGPADWQGWVQERGLYFAHSWDPAWKPVLEMHDPGEPPLEGSLLVAGVGRGRYVYTGVSFFRQLPAGVPGAWRLFANLLALGEAPRGARRAPATPGTPKVERE